jgi:hypothetical protein
VATLPAPAALRLQRPSWRDGRLVAGVLLVLLATALGAKLIASADDTVPMYAAVTALVPGQPVTPQQLRRVDVQLGADVTAYARADRVLSSDTYALREVRAGELLPVSALGTRASVGVEPVTVPVDSGSAASLQSGSVVDVWVNARDPASAAPRYLKPVLVLRSSTVARVPDAKSALSGATGTASIQIMVSSEKVQQLIGSVDQGAKVTLVPVAGSPLKASS